MRAVGAWVRPFIDTQIVKRRRAVVRLQQRRPDLVGVYALADILVEGVTWSA